MKESESIIFVFNNLKQAMHYQITQEASYRSKHPHTTSHLGIWGAGKFSVEFIIKA